MVLAVEVVLLVDGRSGRFRLMMSNAGPQQGEIQVGVTMNIGLRRCEKGERQCA